MVLQEGSGGVSDGKPGLTQAELVSHDSGSPSWQDHGVEVCNNGSAEQFCY